MKLTVKIFILFVFCSLLKTNGQNLIPNPTLDFHSQCPQSSSQSLFVAAPWEELVPTVDYYHNCASESSGKGRTCPGEVGIHLWWGAHVNGYREYFGIQLSQPLVAGSVYYAEYWVKRENSYIYASDDIGMYIRAGKPTSTNYINYWNLVPQIENPQGQIIYNDSTWTKICGTYLAQGGEDYIVFGCFKNESNITLVNINPSGGDRCYYYFDDFYFGLASQLNNTNACSINDVTHDVFKCKEDGMVLPNIFTPNNDSINDYYLPVTLPNHTIERIEMKIYDRWGKKIADIKESEIRGWDGTHNGKDMNDGIYYVVLIYYESPYGFEGKLKGFFHLLR